MEVGSTDAYCHGAGALKGADSTLTEGVRGRDGRAAALAYLAPTLFAAIVPLLTLPIYTRLLGRDEYGAWGLATAVGALASGALGLGLQVGYERSYFGQPDAGRRHDLLVSVVSLALPLQGVGLIAVALAGQSLAARLFGSTASPWLFALAFTVASLGGLKQFFLTTLRNEGRASEFLRFSIDDLFLGSVLSIGAVVGLGWGAAGLLVGPAVSSAVIALALAWRCLRGRPLRFDREQLRGVLAVSLPLAPRVIIGAVGNQLDRLVLGAVASLSGVGLYTVAQRIAQVVFQFMTALQQVYQPSVYRMFFASAPPSEIGRHLLPWAYASVAGALAAILFASEALRLVTGPEFWGGDLMVGVLALHYGLMFFGKQPQLVFARRSAWISMLSVAAVVVNATFVYFGAAWAGGIGAAVGTLCAGVLLGGASLYLSQRVAPIGYPSRTTAAIFSALPLALFTVAFARSLPLSAGIVLLLKSAFVGSFVVLGWRSGILSSLKHATRVPNAT